MKTVIPLLAGAMLVALVSPALAGQSTPKEREVTRQLNIEQAQMAKNANVTASTSMPSQSASSISPATPAESVPDASPSNANQGADPSPAAPAQ